MKLPQSARLLAAFSLSALATVLVNCQKPSQGQAGEVSPASQNTGAGLPVCSTVSNVKTANCTIEAGADGSDTIHYQLVASRQNLKVKVKNGEKPDISLQDALVYNGSLTPERIEVRRGDELRVDFRNELTMPDNGRFDNIGSHNPVDNVLDMNPRFTNLHTHGVVTPWDFKDSSKGRGDNVLGILLAAKQGLPEGINPADFCSTTGDKVSYRYTFAKDHPIGLNWYHPHPHGTSGFQVEGGMSGLLMVADAKAEGLLNPVYLQIKDMQASRVDGANTYQFEKFDPSVPPACFKQADDGGWTFEGDAPGRCDYRKQDFGQWYSWFFMVNGQLFPTIKVPQTAYLRLSNSSANATYRLVLEPDAVDKQAEDGVGVSYYTPPLRVLEKDGMTTVDKATTVAHESCTLPMMTSTRVGVALDFANPGASGSVCKLTVTRSRDDSGKPRKSYTVEKVAFDDAAKADVEKQPKILSYNLLQEGIDTGEDDWPAVSLAKLELDTTLLSADFDDYQKAIQQAGGQTVVAHVDRDDVLPPAACEVTPFDHDTDGVKRRHVALFYGSTESDAYGGPGTEHFGLAATGEKIDLSPGASDTALVTTATIESWRKEYQAQFTSSALSNSYQTGGSTFQEYDAPSLEETGLLKLIGHKFRIEKNGNIRTSICTQLGNQPEHWRIHNLSAQIHNFHIHQMKFHVVGVRGATCQAKAGGLAHPGANGQPAHAYQFVDSDGYLPMNPGNDVLKNVMDDQCSKSYADLFGDLPASFSLLERPVPAGTTGTAAAPAMMASARSMESVDYGWHDTFPVPPMGYIDIDVPLTQPEQVGEYVFHCHILEHEDAGMMGKLVVRPKS